jgi:LAO/AO transport system ATPase/methylmalonyl-CoA epimerase
MQTHTADPGIYIRSMATRGALGGLSAGTLDAAVVLDASGKDYILVETVGVGQDEIDVMRVADVTLVLLVPGMGDDVQAFKAGIMEIADIFVLNKSDLDGADRLEAEVRALLSVGSANKESALSPPPIVRTVAVRREGLEQLLDSLLDHLDVSRGGEEHKRKQIGRWRQRLVELLRERALERVLGDGLRERSLDEYAAAVASRQSDPYSLVEQIFEQAAAASKTQRATEARVMATSAIENDTPTLDHLGVAVASLADAVAFYERSLGLKVSGYEAIPHEKTRVAMLPVGDSRIELMEGTAADSPIARFLAKRGPGLHHISLRVPNLDSAITRLKQNGIKIINSEPGIGAGGHRYIFVHPSSGGGVLVELVEPARDE